MKVYILGPMRGIKDHNFPAFDEAARRLREAGYVPVSPTDMDRLFEGWGEVPPPEFSEGFDKQDLKRFILRDLVALMDCDAVYKLPGWENSRGARVESALAEFLGLEEVELGREWIASIGWH